MMDCLSTTNLRCCVLLLYMACQPLMICFGQDEHNALHQAASGGFLDIVKYLIPNCINEMVNQTSKGNTCLHLAAQHGHLPVVKYLIGECGFDVSLRNQVRYTICTRF